MEKVSKTDTVQPKEIERDREIKSSLMAPPQLRLNWVASQIALNVYSLQPRLCHSLHGNFPCIQVSNKKKKCYNLSIQNYNKLV